MKGRSLRVEKPQVPPLRSPGFPIGVGALANFMRLSLESSTGVADPRDMKRGSSCPRQKVQQIPGCPILRAFCEGWDTTNLDTDGRISHPLQRTQRMGHPPIRGASCRAQHQPRLNRELFSFRHISAQKLPSVAKAHCSWFLYVRAEARTLH